MSFDEEEDITGGAEPDFSEDFDDMDLGDEGMDFREDDSERTPDDDYS
jgi:hypothetical protein